MLHLHVNVNLAEKYMMEVAASRHLFFCPIFTICVVGKQVAVGKPVVLTLSLNGVL